MAFPLGLVTPTLTIISDPNEIALYIGSLAPPSKFFSHDSQVIIPLIYKSFKIVFNLFAFSFAPSG